MSSVRKITEGEFRARFSPECYPGTTVLVPRDWPRDAAILGEAVDDRRCWTVKGGEGGSSVIVSGHDPEDRHFSVISELAYGEGELYQIDDDEWEQQD